jgi:hypothetical protein
MAPNPIIGHFGRVRKADGKPALVGSIEETLSHGPKVVKYYAPFMALVKPVSMKLYWRSEPVRMFSIVPSLIGQ